MERVDLWISNNYNKGTKQFWKAILGNYVPFNDITLAYNDYGKPRLSGEPSIYFNVSHTSNVAVVGVSSSLELGVDIEPINRKITNTSLIINQFFHRKERLVLEQSRNYDRDFICLWVIKEAFVKMKGLGIVYGLNNFIVNIKEESIFDINDQKYYGYNMIEVNNEFICCIVPKFLNIRVFNFFV